MPEFISRASTRVKLDSRLRGNDGENVHDYETLHDSASVECSVNKFYNRIFVPEFNNIQRCVILLNPENVL